ncbi:MAG: hypothetical protein HQL52_13675 [Magnetococcales bacterium]|nr:hypothetical protein [Magnetococcales bacterium]
MNANWTDFNDADSQTSYDLIPKGTIVPVRMTIKPGGFDDSNRGWTGGYAMRNPETGSVYLNCEFVITQGPYARRKVWSLIGLFSHKGPEWGNMGRSFIRAILNSSRGISEKDNSPQAAQARRINGLADLDGIEFLAKLDVEKDQHDNDKNVIKFAITPDHKEYGNHGTGGGAPPAPPAPATSQAPAATGGWQQNGPAGGDQSPQQNWQQPVQQSQPAQSAQGVPPRPQWAQ